MRNTEVEIKPVAGVSRGSNRFFFLLPQVKESSQFIEQPISHDEKRYLDKLLEECEISDYYITNLLKCYSDSYQRDDIDICACWIEKEIMATRPEVIFVMGKEAADKMLDKKQKISDIIGREFTVNGKLVVPLHSPHSAMMSSKKMKENKKYVQKYKDARRSC